MESRSDWRGWNSDTWRSWPHHVLVDETSPSSMVPNRDISPFVEQYRSAGEAVLANESLRSHTIYYGHMPNEVITWVPAFGDFLAGAPVFVFIHGGYWQRLSRVDGLFAAPSFVADGFHYVSVDYTLAPTATLDYIVDQVRRALSWVTSKGQFTRVIVGGHSAGAQLAALGHSRLPTSPLVLFGGVFDLEPLVQTPTNDALGLTREDAIRLSPMHLPVIPAHCMLVTGEFETDHFKYQSHAYAELRRRSGKTIDELEIPGTNHFDVIFTLADETSPVREWIRQH